MSNPSSPPQVSPADLLRNIPDAPVRIGAVILSILSILSLALPVVSLEGAFSLAGSVNITNPVVLGGWSYLLPMMAIASLVVPALDATRPYSKLTDISFTVVAGFILAIVAYYMWRDIAQANQVQQGVSLLTGTRPPPGMPKLFELHWSFAIVTLTLCPLVGAYLLWRQR